MGKVVFIGAGQGHIALMTLFGKECISRADCIVIDGELSGQLLDYARKDCEVFSVGGDLNYQSVSPENVGELLLKKSNEYNNVVRLMYGDSFDKDGIPKDALYLQRNEVDTMVVPGIRASEQIVFLDNQPLAGKTFFVPYTKNGFYSFNEGWVTTDNDELTIKLRLLGANIIPYQTGEVRPVECNLLPLKKIVDGDYILFTSANAVYATMWNICKEHMDVRAFGQARFAVLGKKTATALEEFGLRPAIVSRKNTLAGLGEIMSALVKSDTKVLWFYSGENSKALDNCIYDKCRFEKYIVYENCESLAIPKNRKEIENCDGAVLTRSVIAKRTATSVKRFPSKVYSIGGTCSRALRECGIKGIKESAVPTIDSLVELLLQDNT